MSSAAMFTAVTGAEAQQIRLEVIANTPEDILEAVEEMMARLNGEFPTTEKDQINIRRYRELNDYFGIRTPSTPTASFLRRYPHLIE